MVAKTKSITTSSVKRTNSKIKQVPVVENETSVRNEVREQKQDDIICEQPISIEKREDSGNKIDLNLVNLPDDEHDRRLFNSTMSTDNESDIRYKVEESSVGYDDIGCCKIPGFCKFTQGTWSIDDDSSQERYNTYDETYNHLMRKKQEKKRREMEATSLIDSNQMKKEIELPLKNTNKVGENNVVVSGVEANEEQSVHSSSKSVHSVKSENQTEPPLPLNRSSSAKSQKDEDVKAEETKEQSDDPSAEDNIVTLKEPSMSDEAKPEEQNKNEEKDIKSRKSLKKSKSLPFFKKQKKDSLKKEKKKGMFSFLKKKSTKKSKSNKKDESKEDVTQDDTTKSIIVDELDDKNAIDQTQDIIKSTDEDTQLKSTDDIAKPDDTESQHSTKNNIQKTNSSVSNQIDTNNSNTKQEEKTVDGSQNKIEKNNTPEDQNASNVSLDSIGESLGAFISFAGDKFYETYMGYGQKK